VKYVGAEIAAVAAEDRETAERALHAILVDYEVLPAVIGMEAAMRPEAPEVHQGVFKSHPSSAEEWNHGTLDNFRYNRRIMLNPLPSPNEDIFAWSG
jgi:CO/xanthine dehydrogenase Mo-binding subunit